MKLLVGCLTLLLSLGVNSQEETRLALVIGNANYDKGELKNPVNDALLIAQTLKGLDFDVILDTNIVNKAELDLYIKRGKLWKIIKDDKEMCEDYQKACELGDCELFNTNCK